MVSLIVALGACVFAAVFLGFSWSLSFWLSIVGLIIYKLTIRSLASLQQPQQTRTGESTLEHAAMSSRTVPPPPSSMPHEVGRTAGYPEPHNTTATRQRKTEGTERSDDVIEVVLTVEQPARHAVSTPSPSEPVVPVQSRSIPRDPGRWYGPGEPIRVGAVNLTGLVYVGHVLVGANGSPDPALINPLLPIGDKGDCRVADFGYYPSYSQLSPVSRHAYLRWLSEGRNDPACNLGYVFLYLYGFERRILVDLRDKPFSLDEYAPIAAELYRLWCIYGPLSRSFAGYCSSLLIVVLGLTADAGYALPDFPDFRESSVDMPFLLRIRIARYMIEDKPLPYPLIREWVAGPGPIQCGSLLPKYEGPFFALFDVMFQARFPEGLLIKSCATRIRLNYRPSSSAFNCMPEERLVLSHLPDVKAMSSPVQKIQGVVNDVGGLIEPVRRTLSKLIQREDDAWRWLFDPQLWSAQAKEALRDWQTRVESGLVVVTGAQWLQELGANNFTKDQIKRVALYLGEFGIGIEPDLVSRSALLQPDEMLVLFASQPEKSTAKSLQHFAVATLMMDLVTTVARADGTISGDEIRFLTQHIETWPDLSQTQRTRLKARLRLVMTQPVSLTSLKSKVQELDEANRLSVAKLAVALVHADGTVTAEEVNFLTKLYKLLSLDTARVAADVHASSMAAVATPAPAAQMTVGQGFALDAAKIAQLQSESSQVAALMNTIFIDIDDKPVEPPDTTDSEPPEAAEPTFEAPVTAQMWGLDLAHSTFLRMLLDQSVWTRAELRVLAKDLGIMLDGALERINDASYDQFDEPLTEGEDPVTVQTHLMTVHHDTN